MLHRSLTEVGEGADATLGGTGENRRGVRIVVVVVSTQPYLT